MSRQQTTTLGNLVQSSPVNELIDRLTTGDYTPLDDAMSPPWFEQGIITEVDCQIWRFSFADAGATTITDDKGRLYFLVDNETVAPRLFWQQGELFLARELSATEARALTSDRPPIAGDGVDETGLGPPDAD